MVLQLNFQTMINIYTDGATVGYNGKLGTVKEVGIGIYCPDKNYKYSARVNGISNNEAEFKALIKAMEWAVSENILYAQFNLDSKIVINRAKGNKPKSKKHQNKRMDAFQETVLALSNKFLFIDFIWIPREKNTIADYLSKRSINLY